MVGKGRRSEFITTKEVEGQHFVPSCFHFCKAFLGALGSIWDVLLDLSMHTLVAPQRTLFLKAYRGVAFPHFHTVVTNRNKVIKKRSVMIMLRTLKAFKFSRYLARVSGHARSGTSTTVLCPSRQGAKFCDERGFPLMERERKETFLTFSASSSLIALRRHLFENE